MDDFNSLTLRGSRVVLKSIELEEAEALFNLIDSSREHLTKWLPWVDYVRSVDDERHIVEQWIYEMQMRAAIHLGIIKDGEMSGIISTHQIDWLNQRTSIGYWIAKNRTRNHLATEATAVLMAYLFDNLKLHRIYIQAATDNEPSNRVIRKLGFKLEGVLKENERIREVFLDHNIYGMMEQDFRGFKERFAPYLPR